MIDLHCHLLPGVDDGARTATQAAAVLRDMAREGVTDVCLTPHLLASAAERGVPAGHQAAFAALQALAPASPRLHRGAEVMLDRPLAPAVAENPDVRLGGTRYVLVEFPRIVTAETVGHALAHVVSLGLVPVLAHPERYTSCTVENVRWWRAIGGRMQVDATTLLSSERRGERARKLVAAGLADLIAADNHGDTRTLGAAWRMLHEQGGAEQAELLAVRNPGAILRDRPLEPVPPLALKISFFGRLRRLWQSSDA